MLRLRTLYLVWFVLALMALSVSPVLAAEMPETLAQAQTVHTVQPGENLFRIALRYGTTVDAIQAANGLPNTTIRSGQRLVIPTGAAAAPSAPSSSGTATGGAYVVQRGDTLFRIALRYGVTVAALAQANNLGGSSMIYAGQRLVIPGSGSASQPASQPAGTAGATYTVQPGDTLSRIAALHGTTVAALAQANGLANPSVIRVGQVLRIAGAGAAPTPISGGAKQIVVDLSEQRLYAYQNGQLVFSFIASSGIASSPTRTGNFQVQSKIPNAWGSTWSIWMPHWLGIYWAGSIENGIHALPVMSNGQTLWAGYLGRPVTFGCIVLGTADAAALYNWAEIGTPVQIRY
mgnify:CR=1 FL=1